MNEVQSTTTVASFSVQQIYKHPAAKENMGKSQKRDWFSIGCWIHSRKTIHLYTRCTLYRPPIVPSDTCCTSPPSWTAGKASPSSLAASPRLEGESWPSCPPRSAHGRGRSAARLVWLWNCYIGVVETGSIHQHIWQSHGGYGIGFLLSLWSLVHVHLRPNYVGRHGVADEKLRGVAEPTEATF